MDHCVFILFAFHIPCLFLFAPPSCYYFLHLPLPIKHSTQRVARIREVHGSNSDHGQTVLRCHRYSSPFLSTLRSLPAPPVMIHHLNPRYNIQKLHLTSYDYLINIPLFSSVHFTSYFFELHFLSHIKIIPLSIRDPFFDTISFLGPFSCPKITAVSHS
jgi:hypothetical protein